MGLHKGPYHVGQKHEIPPGETHCRYIRDASTSGLKFLNFPEAEASDTFERTDKLNTICMKKSLITGGVAALAVMLFSGCVGLSIGGGSKTQTQTATVGQQLIDLQKAKEAGAINDAEYQSEKSKLLGRN